MRKILILLIIHIVLLILVSFGLYDARDMATAPGVLYGVWFVGVYLWLIWPMWFSWQAIVVHDSWVQSLWRSWWRIMIWELLIVAVVTAILAPGSLDTASTVVMIAGFGMLLGASTGILISIVILLAKSVLTRRS